MDYLFYYLYYLVVCFLFFLILYNDTNIYYNIVIVCYISFICTFFIKLIIYLLLINYIITRPIRHKLYKGLTKPTILQQVFFYLAMLLLYAVKGAPIDLLSHIMMSAHMTQMAILYFVIPIFIIRGIPEWILRSFVDLPIVKQIFSIFTKPIIALAIFNCFFAMYHIPMIFDFTKSNQPVHIAVTLFLFITAVFMWWPIVTPLKEHNKLQPLLKMGYLLVSIFVVAIACALIIFASAPLFAAYSSQGDWIQSLSLCVPPDVLNGISGDLSGPEMFSPLSALEDQQLGGVIMMYLQEFVYGIILTWIFFSWFTKRSLEIDPLPTDNPSN